MNNRNMLVLLLIAVLAIGAFLVLNMPDHRSTGQRVGDAVDALPHGVGAATKQLQDRTPGEKVNDAVKDAGQDLK